LILLEFSELKYSAIFSVENGKKARDMEKIYGIKPIIFTGTCFLNDRCYFERSTTAHRVQTKGLSPALGFLGMTLSTRMKNPEAGAGGQKQPPAHSP
jgi:hypothetical protein